MRLSLIGVLAASLGCGPALAQPPSPPALASATGPAAVSITIGPQLQKRSSDLGEDAFQDLVADLRHAVEHALAHPKGPAPIAVNLVIEDAVPDRPTMAQLDRTPGLSVRSIGLGGAKVSGTVTYPGGVQRPFKEQYFATDLADVHGFATWYDADIAFDRVAFDIQRGKLPKAYDGAGPSNVGHFGYPLTND